ncbi:MAG TPA: hypothetical protein VGC42_01035, partial [Kofleriaceae bacterium]
GTSWYQPTRNDNNETASGLVFDSGGSTVTTFEMNAIGRAMRIEQRSAGGGGLSWSIEKKAGGYNFEDDPVPWAIAADHSKRIAVAIDWFEPIIAVYQMP